MGLFRGVYGDIVRLPTLYTLWSLIGVVALATAYSVGKGTPRNMGEIVIGRCEEYQRVIRPELFKKNELKNCTDLWMKFRKAFANKGPCDVTVDSYNDFIRAADHWIDTQDKVMYWSGIYPLVVSYTRLKSKQYITIRDILAAYVTLNIEDWCGQLESPGLNHDGCPSWGSCPLLAATSFWTALSKSFAKEVKGTVHLLLNGSSDAAYLNTSIFAQSELKNLDAERTPSMHVHLAYALRGPIKERCGHGTLVTLRQDVEKKGMKFKCTDDDLDILYFQCVTDVGAERCRAIQTDGGGQAGGSRPSYSNGAIPEHPLGLTSAFLVALLIAEMCVIQYKQL